MSITNITATPRSPGALMLGQIPSSILLGVASLICSYVCFLLLTASWILLCVILTRWPTEVGSSLGMVWLSQLLSSLLLYSALYFNPLQTPKSENIPKHDSSNLLPYKDHKTRLDLRPQSRGQKQVAPREDFISRHILSSIHSSFF